MSYENSTETVILALLAGQSAIGAVAMKSEDANGRPGMDRIIVIAAPEQPALLSSDGARVRAWKIPVTIEQNLVTRDAATMDVWTTAIERAINGAYIATIATGSPAPITTANPHGFATGLSVTILGSSGGTPSINGTHTITVTGATTFTIPVNVTVAGSGGQIVPAAAITAAAAAFPNGFRIENAPDGSRENEDNTRVRIQAYEVIAPA